MPTRIARTRPVVHRAVNPNWVQTLCGVTTLEGEMLTLSDAQTNCPKCWDVIAARRVAARNDAA